MSHKNAMNYCKLQQYNNPNELDDNSKFCDSNCCNTTNIYSNEFKVEPNEVGSKNSIIPSYSKESPIVRFSSNITHLTNQMMTLNNSNHIRYKVIIQNSFIDKPKPSKFMLCGQNGCDIF